MKIFFASRKTENVVAYFEKPIVKFVVGTATSTDVKNTTAMSTAISAASGKVSNLKSASQRKFQNVCHHCGVFGHIRPRCFKLSREESDEASL